MVYTPAPAPNICTTDVVETVVTLNRSTHTPGSAIVLGAGDSVIYISNNNGVGTVCSSWSGTINWVSDLPSWRVDVDLTCTTGSLHFVSSFHGRL